MRSRVKKSRLRSLLGGASALGLAVAALSFLPYASAQYPGGYPGGRGWVAKPWPDAPPWASPDYEWTKLRGTIATTTYNGYHYGSTFTWSAGMYFDPFTVGGPYGNASVTFSTSGASTYKWDWVPPNDPVSGAPDTTNFPPPSLFVLGDVRASTSAALRGASTSVGGSGQVSDGFGGGWSPSFNTVPGQAGVGPADPTRRSVLGAGIGMEQGVSLSPSLYIGLFGGTPQDGGVYGAGEIHLSVHPIELSSPNVFTRPDKGMGGNQFVYGDFSGELHIPIHVSVTGGSHDDAVWLNGGEKVQVSPIHADVVVDPEPPNFLPPTEWWAVNNGVEPSTERIFNTEETGDFVYLGLPFDNNGFGDRTATLKVDGTSSEVAHVQTFFPKSASNWPGAVDDIPNWFHYYTFAVPPSGSFPYGWNPSLLYPHAAFCAVQWHPYSVAQDSYMVDGCLIELGQETPNLTRIPVFGIGTDGYIETLGVLEVHGIHSYIRAYQEELAHAQLFTTHTVLPPPNPQSVRPPVLDTDNDLVPNEKETELGFLNQFEPDTSGYFDYYENFQDAEALANIAALGKLLEQKEAWHLDWSDGGLQFGSRPPYPTTPERTFFPWTFHPADTSLPDTDQIPSNAITSLPIWCTQ